MLFVQVNLSIRLWFFFAHFRSHLSAAKGGAVLLPRSTSRKCVMSIFAVILIRYFAACSTFEKIKFPYQKQMQTFARPISHFIQISYLH